MCKLSETCERWTSLGTSHDEPIMTASAISLFLAKCNAKFCELIDAEIEADEYFRAHERAMTERADTSGMILNEPWVIASTLWIGRDVVDQA